MRRVIFASVLLLAASSAAVAGLAGSDLFLISVGRGPGASDSTWYTTVWVHNPGPTQQVVTASFLRRDQANTAPEQQVFTVEAGETMKIGDILFDLFGVESGAGALRFETGSRIFVSSRIYNLPGPEIAESQGQFMAGLPAELAASTGETVDVSGITQPEDDAFRCNFALVETTGSPTEVEVTLHNGFGATLASKSYSLLPFQPMQKNLSDLGAAAVVDGGRLQVEVSSGSGRVLAVASMVGNGAQSQDPSTLEMEFEMPSTEGGLTLPYDGSAPAAGAAFKITNTSPTGNVFGIRGDNSSTSGAGVYGRSNATSGGNAGVIGQTSSNAGAGVFGFSDASTGDTFGVYGSSASDQGTGVFGVALGESGTRAHGVHGKTSSPNSAGVYAEGLNHAADLMLAGHRGKISSDRHTPGSDLVLAANQSLYIDLDYFNTTTANLVISNGDLEMMLEVDEDGDVSQSEFGQGLVKAGAVIDCGQTGTVIRKSFNLINDDPITVENGRVPGMCLVDFPFIVENHYVVVSAIGQMVFAGHSTDTFSELYAIYRYDMFVGGTSNGWVTVLVY